MSKIKYNNCALVITANATGLAVIRSLNKVGVDTVIFSRPDDLCLFSNIPVEKNIYNIDSWKEGLLASLNQYENLDLVLIPTADIHLEFIYENYEYLNNKFILSVTNTETLYKLTDKSKESELIESMGVLAPKTLFSVNNKDIETLALPIIFKAKSHSNNPLIKKNIVVNTEDELTSFVNEFENTYGSIIAQEVIPGGEEDLWITSCTFNKGKLVSFFCYQRRSASPKLYGVTSFAESKYNETLEILSRSIGENLEYHGNADIEFKWDYRDGTFKYIELNARIGMLGWFDTVCGVNNIANSYYIFSNNQRLIKSERQKDGLLLLSLYEDFYSRRKAGEHIVSIFSLYIKSIQALKASLFFTIKDPTPGIVAYYRYTSAMVASITRKIRS